MINVSCPLQTPPQSYKTPLHQKVYATLQELDIPFSRVDCDPAVTMEDCISIDRRLNVKTVKTLLLCNRQQTVFYLFVTPGDKPFRSKNFGAALEVSRVSFAPAEKLGELLGTEMGATTVFSLLLDSAKDVTAVFDSEVFENEWYGCTDGTTTGYMKIPTDRLVNDLLPRTGHKYKVISVSGD